MKRMAGCTIALVLCAVMSGAVRAQQTSHTETMQAQRCPELVALPIDSAGAAALRPDVVIHATATAQQLTFTGQPRASVRFTGCGVRDTVHVLERTNLPKPVVSGTTYRNVKIAVEILAYLDVECILNQLNAAIAPADSAGRANASTCRRKP